ncbi:hypothetical protein BLNAU_9625 [Blattamonas nauphoetae]|uniref:Uncharacterized protein n=1 Tax=Blattamonas nauphoetae TaxID=2049346 RepID=A0ABQ9XV85_9EUKA|nr:hypothetical protein BLNAU_9625 [Blattamonas nauphoetae]
MDTSEHSVREEELQVFLSKCIHPHISTDVICLLLQPQLPLGRDGFHNRIRQRFPGGASFCQGTLPFLFDLCSTSDWLMVQIRETSTGMVIVNVFECPIISQMPRFDERSSSADLLSVEIVLDDGKEFGVYMLLCVDHQSARKPALFRHLNEAVMTLHCEAVLMLPPPLVVLRKDISGFDDLSDRENLFFCMFVVMRDPCIVLAVNGAGIAIILVTYLRNCLDFDCWQDLRYETI